MSPTNKAATRMVVASFAAGVGAMVLVGLVAPVTVNGGLVIRDAVAASLQRDTPTIDPLDVEAIEAQLAEAEREMQQARESTADEIGRLQRLSR